MGDMRTEHALAIVARAAPARAGRRARSCRRARGVGRRCSGTGTRARTGDGQGIARPSRDGGRLPAAVHRFVESTADRVAARPDVGGAARDLDRRRRHCGTRMGPRLRGARGDCRARSSVRSVSSRRHPDNCGLRGSRGGGGARRRRGRDDEAVGFETLFLASCDVLGGRRGRSRTSHLAPAGGVGLRRAVRAVLRRGATHDGVHRVHVGRKPARRILALRTPCVRRDGPE